MNLYEPSTIQLLRAKHGFNFTKSLGQNFLTNKYAVDKIVEGAAIGKDDLVIEIGPGIGVITHEAARLAKKVIAVEIDKNLIPILNDTLSELDNVEIINDDILNLDLNEIFKREDFKGVKIMGNLPYYITTPIIMKILESGVDADSITIMMQKEVADRIKSLPNKKTYGAISLAVQYYCTVEKVADCPKGYFVPMPKVDSVVLNLHIRKEKPVSLKDENLFFSVIKAGFGQRRKTLLNSLQTLTDFDKEEIKEALLESGIAAERRAETLDIEEFAKLANSFAALKEKK